MERALPECYGNYYKYDKPRCRACFAAQDCKTEKDDKPKRGRKATVKQEDVKITAVDDAPGYDDIEIEVE